MTKYAKLISETQIEFPPKNKGSIINYNLDYEQLVIDGYKEFIEAQKEIGKSYTITYTETSTQIIENAVEIIPDPAIVLQNAKQAKVSENDTARDEALLQGVTYKNVLFDSDTDQKINLLAIVSTMSDEDEITWFGMDNQPLECTKQDLINIGGLITQLHSFCWNKNALIKQAIEDATTVEEVNAIEIDYEVEND